MEFANNTIKLDKEINELDRLVINFVRLFEKCTSYVIVSGYVAILLGRDRGTEDIDIIIPKIDKQKLSEIYNVLLDNGFWCLNSSDINDLFELLASKGSIRFALEPKISPNFEIKFSKDSYDDMALKNPITVILGDEELKTSFLELQIAFKEEVLKSNKDIEDANHIRLMAKGHLNENLINEYKIKLKNRK